MQERLPRDMAMDFLRPYVERGDSVDALARSQMGYAGPDYWAQIGGAVWVRTGRSPGEERVVTLRPREVAITRIADGPCLHRFRLEELQREIRAEKAGGPPRPQQPRLF